MWYFICMHVVRSMLDDWCILCGWFHVELCGFILLHKTENPSIKCTSFHPTCTHFEQHFWVRSMMDFIVHAQYLRAEKMTFSCCLLLLLKSITCLLTSLHKTSLKIWYFGKMNNGLKSPLHGTIFDILKAEIYHCICEIKIQFLHAQVYVRSC